MEFEQQGTLILHTDGGHLFEIYDLKDAIGAYFHTKIQKCPNCIADWEMTGMTDMSEVLKRSNILDPIDYIHIRNEQVELTAEEDRTEIEEVDAVVAEVSTKNGNHYKMVAEQAIYLAMASGELNKDFVIKIDVDLMEKQRAENEDVERHLALLADTPEYQALKALFGGNFFE